MYTGRPMTGTGTGGTMTGTGTGGTMTGTGTGGTMTGTGTGTPGTGTGTGGTMTGTGTGGTLTGTGTGGTGTGGTGTGGTGTGGTMTGTGTGGTVVSGSYTVLCVDHVKNCADYGQQTCNDPTYAGWVKDNCAKTCNKCAYLSGSSNGGTGFIPVYTPDGHVYTGTKYTNTGTHYPGGTMTGTGGTGTGTFTGTGTGTGGTMTGTGTGTGGTMTGTGTGGTMTGTGTGGTMTGTGTGGTMTGTGTGTMTGGSCVDKPGTNCASYGKTVCTDSKYTGWVQDNCCAYCATSGMTSGGTMVNTGTGSGHVGQSTGCVYNNQVYQQGQKWKDGCKYQCTCTNASSGMYNCQSLCVQFNLPSVCTMQQPAAGMCCQTPSCPPTVQIQYPPGYTPQ